MSRRFLTTAACAVSITLLVTFGLAPGTASAATTCGSGYKFVAKEDSKHLSARLYFKQSSGTWCARTLRKGSWKGATGWTRITLTDYTDSGTREWQGDTPRSTQTVKLTRECVYFDGLGFKQRWVDRGTRSPESTHLSDEWCYADIT